MSGLRFPPALPIPRLPRHLHRRGFTLIELAIVCVLIGILAAMASYTYRTLMNKARMTQARTILLHLSKVETVYYSTHDRYTDDLSAIDFDPVKYNYYNMSVLLDNTSQNYTGIAAGVDSMSGDWWTIQKDGEPTQCDNSVFK